MLEITYILPAQTAVQPTSETFFLPISTQTQTGNLLTTTYPNGVRLEQRIGEISGGTVEVLESRYFLADGRQAAVISPFTLDGSNLEASLLALSGANVNLSAFDDTFDYFLFTGTEPGAPFDNDGAVFDFGVGEDILLLRGEELDVSFAPRADGAIDFTYGGTPAVLENLERIVLTDRAISIVDGSLVGGGFGAGLAAEEARTVAYLYEAGLDRNGEIDAPGLNFWIDRREAGLTERGLAQAFLNSPEFEAAIGAPESLTDRALVEQLYRNVLDREGEAGGIAFWEGQLARSVVSRADLLLAFAESPENVEGSPQVLDLAEVGPGQWDFLA